MGGGDRRGGRLELLPLIRKYEDAVELDLFDRGVDYRDRWRPGGGASRLTLRRLLLLVCGMDPFESRFWMLCGRLDLWEKFNEGVTPDHYAQTTNRLVSDVVAMFAEKPHPWRTWRDDLRAEREKLAKREAILRADRERKRRIQLMSKEPVKPSLNAVSAVELAEVSGVPLWVAERVVAHREERGPFASVDGVRGVSGVGVRRFELIAAAVRV